MRMKDMARGDRAVFILIAKQYNLYTLHVLHMYNTWLVTTCLL